MRAMITHALFNTDEPVSRFVESMIHGAITKNASDIHLEPLNLNYRIRYRQQGLLYFINEITSEFAERVIARIKILAKLDIAETRLPQDGGFNHIRINTCPTLYGEKVVLRLLNNEKNLLPVTELGLTLQQCDIFLKKISQPQGLILITGPTGSGKTITLYSALTYLNSPERNISTIEDPIEIQLPEINQMNIHSKIGLDFSQSLRALLRQDPDIIMLGEIRDEQTAKIALRAAQTGHLVLTTLHSNTAMQSITRLETLNIDIKHIMQSVTLIVAQRLARKLCNNCKVFLNDHCIANKNGCAHCLQGYAGRIGIYELLSIDNGKMSQHDVLHDKAVNLIKTGCTSHDEIRRILPL